MAAAVPAAAEDSSKVSALVRAEYDELRALPEPVVVRGTVVKGFGRGSKELGIPTANLDPEALGDAALTALPPGVYFGWASVGKSPVVHKMVMSIGWNPFYKNERKTVEPHLLHAFEEDFYGQELRLAVTGYLRPEKNYPSLDALIAAIHADIALAREELDSEPHAAKGGHAFLRPDAEAAAPAPDAAPASA